MTTRDYRDAPATKMLATHCAACGKELVDANSVEAGMGPDCRKMYGAPEHATDEVRAQANKLVYEIALDQAGPRVAEHIDNLKGLGYTTLAERIEKRLRAISIVAEGGRLVVRTPYNESVVAEMKRVSGRRWDKERKVNTFPANQKRAVWDILVRYFSGHHATGPKGSFIIGPKTPAKAAPKPVEAPKPAPAPRTAARKRPARKPMGPAKDPLTVAIECDMEAAEAKAASIAAEDAAMKEMEALAEREAEERANLVAMEAEEEAGRKAEAERKAEAAAHKTQMDIRDLWSKMNKEAV